MTHILLLDTSSLMYRAFFALPQSISDPNGNPVNALHGYLDMTTRLMSDFKPDRLIHVYDADWRPAGRTDVYPDYKGNRQEDPEALPPQFERLRPLLNALGMEQAEAPKWEADDAIGTLCAQADPADKIGIVTGDRDLLQLANDGQPRVRILYTVRGVSQLEEFNEAAVAGKYGVPPSRYVDFAILRGDPSDGLPGVKGIGEKTAAKLLAKYESLDALLADADSQTPKMAENLRNAVDYVEKMKQIVPVRQDVETRIWQQAADAVLTNQIAQEFGLGGPVARWREEY